MKLPLLLHALLALALTGSAAPPVPKTDPSPEGRVPEMDAALRGRHPRLFLNARTLPRIRQFYSSEEGAVWRRQVEDYLPACEPFDEPKFLDDATDGQRQGLWKLPTAALHYALTGDKASFAKAEGFLRKLEALPHWQTGRERDSGMSSANILVGASLAYDWLFNELDPAFREAFGRKLLHKARAQFHCRSCDYYW